MFEEDYVMRIIKEAVRALLKLLLVSIRQILRWSCWRTRRCGTESQG